MYCLQVWQDNSGPYFNALHLSQSLGFMLAPILAEKVLPSTNDGRSAIQTSADTNDTVQIIPVATGVQMFDHMNTMFSPIQALYLAIGFFTFLIAVCFLAGIPADKKTGSYSVRDKAKSFEEDKEKQVGGTVV